MARVKRGFGAGIRTMWWMAALCAAIYAVMVFVGRDHGPVSYTHLDVYKRQATARSLGLEWCYFLSARISRVRALSLIHI